MVPPNISIENSNEIKRKYITQNRRGSEKADRIEKMLCIPYHELCPACGFHPKAHRHKFMPTWAPICPVAMAACTSYTTGESKDSKRNPRSSSVHSELSQMQVAIDIIKRDVEKASAATRVEQKSVLLAEVKAEAAAQLRVDATAELKEQLRAEFMEEFKAEAAVDKAAGACTPARTTEHMHAAAADAGSEVGGKRIEPDSGVKDKSIMKFFRKAD